MADLVAKAHLWIEGDDQAKALQLEPVVATLRGPLFGGSGDLSLLQVPLSLLALLAPVPPQLRGSIGIRGRYDLSGEAPLLVSDLVLDSANLAGQPLQLESDRSSLTGSCSAWIWPSEAEIARKPSAWPGRFPSIPMLI